MTSQFLLVAVSSASAALVLQLITFAVGLRLRRHSVVDITWGAGFATVALVGWVVTALVGPDGDQLRRGLVAALTVVWGTRLALHIARRQRGGVPEDPRYAELMSRARGNPVWAALRSVYLTQALALWFVSLPVQLALVVPGSFGVLGWVGVMTWAVGFGFESVGDAQLARFKADPANRGTVMDRGLWRYTRHPNYFGDACVWWGLFLLSADRPAGWLTIASPLLMTWLLAAKTGKPLMESQLARTRPGYAEYVARTSGFIPRPPKRG
jgi:steroid 5-alpha reductase family enzyme